MNNLHFILVVMKNTVLSKFELGYNEQKSLPANQIL